jgi:flagellar basal body-associated protein FliL
MEEKKVINKGHVLILIAIVIMIVIVVAISVVFCSSILDLLKAFATPITALLITLFVTRELEKQKRKDTEERNRQEALKDYLNRMTTLLIDKNLSQKPFESPEIQVARALTLSVLRELDLERRKHLIDFLYEAELIQYRCSGTSPALNCIKLISPKQL